LRDQFAEVQREALEVIRAMIDHYLQRAEQPGRRESKLEDIPID
jgi:hypothetical protein